MLRVSLILAGLWLVLGASACSSGPAAWDVLVPSDWPATIVPEGAKSAAISPDGAVKAVIHEYVSDLSADDFLVQWKNRTPHISVIKDVEDRGIQLARRFRASSVATLHLGIRQDKGTGSLRAFAYAKGTTVVLIEIRATRTSARSFTDGSRIAESFRFR